MSDIDPRNIPIASSCRMLATLIRLLPAFVRADETPRAQVQPRAVSLFSLSLPLAPPLLLTSFTQALTHSSTHAHAFYLSLFRFFPTISNMALRSEMGEIMPTAKKSKVSPFTREALDSVSTLPPGSLSLPSIMRRRGVVER